MKATLLLRERIDYPDGALIEIKIWQVPEPVPPSEHPLKYAMVYIVGGARIIGFDNERGKGDHRHDRDVETRYTFVGMAQLLADFRAAVVAERGSI